MEAKGGSKSAPQIGDCVAALRGYRMDLKAVYGLSWSQTDLQLWKCDPNRITMLQSCKWQVDDDAWIEVLFTYVRKVYESIEDRDVTLQYLPEHEGCWQVKLHDAVYVTRPLSRSRPPGSCSCVFFGYKVGDPSKLYIIKDRWTFDDVQFLECDLFYEAHADGTVPGLVKLDNHQVVCQMDADGKTMVKHRYVTSNVGQPVTQCESVFEFLCLTYDLVVTHQMMCERDILHRHVDIQNVLRNMQEGESTDKHIGSILNLPSLRPYALLTGLSHGAKMSEMGEKEPEGSRMGSPMFIALEVAGASPIQHPVMAMPPWNHIEYIKEHISGMENVVEPHFFEHLRNTLQDYIKHSTSETLGVMSSKNRSERITQEPRHDVESMFWSLCFLLCRANPARVASETATECEAYNLFCRTLIPERDEIRPETLRERRGRYLETSEEEWKEVLHPDLADAAALLYHMGSYLAIRSIDAKNESWGTFHAHEMFKLLLWSTIQKFRENPVPVCTHLPRYAPPPDSAESETSEINMGSSGSDVQGHPQEFQDDSENHDHAQKNRYVVHSSAVKSNMVDQIQSSQDMLEDGSSNLRVEKGAIDTSTTKDQEMIVD